MIVPLFTLSTLGSFSLQLAQLSFVFGFIMIAFISNFDLSFRNFPTLSKPLFSTLILFFFLLIMVSIYLDYGFEPQRLFSLESLASLYDIRLEQREQAKNASLISLYGVSWLTKIIIPMLFIYFYHNKKYLIATLFVLSQLYLFTVSAHKSYIIIMMVTFYSYHLLKKGGDSGYRFFRSVVLFCCVSLVIFYLIGNTLLIDILVRRALIVPGMLSGYFIEYFSVNGLALYSKNFMGSIIETRYVMDPSFIIGQEYFNREGMRSNVNAFGDTFANIGFLGVLFNSVLMGLLFLALNTMSHNKNIYIIIPTLCGIAWTFNESSFVTTLTSHGAIFALIIIAFYPKESNEQSTIK
ncbi:hypothetical protein [Pseudoalteromonas sp. GB56]